MITIKLKIETSKENKDRIKEYQKQYSSLLHVYFNRYREGLTQKECKHLELNHVELLDSWFRQSCIYEAMALSNSLDIKISQFNQKMQLKEELKIKQNKSKKQKRQLKKLLRLTKPKTIFGGKSNFRNRSKQLISADQFNQKRLSSIYSIGQKSNYQTKSVKGNRKFFIQDVNTVIFKPSSKQKIELTLLNSSVKYKRYLQLLMQHQNLKDLSITYKLNSQFIWISFDQTILKKQFKTCKPIKDRIIAIDLNPNYIGWSILDWKNSEKFTLIDKGVLSLKKLNDYQFSLKVNSSDKNKKYITNKRNFEVLECSKFLIQKMKHYRCSIFSIEDLKIKTKDSNKGRRFNRLCINNWNRTSLVNNIQKWCNIYNVQLMKVKPQYSSFIGNLVYRSLKLPDMILSSIQISRRAYQFYHQYIEKDKQKQKNIIFIKLSDKIRTSIYQSLEELSIEKPVKWQSLKQLFNFLKKSKCKYRFPLDISKVFQLNSLKFRVIV